MSVLRSSFHLAVALVLIAYNGTLLADSFANHLLVVFNRKSEGAEDLTREYARLRNIPDVRIMSVDASNEEEISRREYNETLRDPIEKYLIEQGWLQREKVQGSDRQKTVKNDIWSIVLMRGIPLKIANDPSLSDPSIKPRELNTSAAAVDSELATLPSGQATYVSFVPNVFYQTPSAHSFDDFDSLEMMLVTRLDGPSVDDVRRMIQDSIAAEKNGLEGFAYLDSRGIRDKKNTYIRGDDWIRGCADRLILSGWEVDMDEQEEIIPENTPWGPTGIYLGWYSGKASGPMCRIPRSFTKGSVAYHLHSFSASSLRTATEHWAGPLIRAGAAATMGCVYEPYLDFTPNLDRFLDRLLRGQTFAEAAGGSVLGLSWMITLVGDPLYRPFALANQDSPCQRLRQLGARIRGGQSQAWEEWFKVIRAVRTDLITLEWAAWQGERSGDEKILAEISGVYQRAMTFAQRPVDRMRVGFAAARWENKRGGQDRALEMLRQLKSNDSPSFASYGGEKVLREIQIRSTTSPQN